MGPHFAYECLKRIFLRSDHGCLSGENKPKAVEVILKFMKLYDGVELGSQSDVYKYFNHIIDLDFLRYHLRQDLEPQTISTLILGFN